jgi:threonine dehydrogenase-like Zn-dependent dehydrogenase
MLKGRGSDVRVVEYNHRDPNFPAELIDTDDPALPADDWARIAVTVGGICGSDLHLFGSRPTRAPALAAFATFPFHLGHEIAGTIVEAGARCAFPVGTRVAVDPAIPCAPRGIDPPCRMCASGRASCCLEFGSRRVTPGMSLGYTMGLGGGWADQVLAHMSMLHAIPDRVPDSIASLHEPVSIAAHGLHRAPPADGDAVLVVGSGIIGLATIATVRALFPNCEITATARHAHQAVAARGAGADHVVSATDGDDHFEQLATFSGARVVGKPGRRMLSGGFRYVVEAVGGLASVTESLRLVDNWGTVLFLGAGGMGEVDLSTLWFKEAQIVGAWNHAAHGDGHSIDVALDILAQGYMPESVVTHRFGLESLRDAITTAQDKRDAHAIKVGFEN